MCLFHSLSINARSFPWLISRCGTDQPSRPFSHIMPTQPSMRKSSSSKRSFLPYLRSASSRLNISALGSTSSIAALFTSAAAQDHRDPCGSGSSPSKQGIFASGIFGAVSGKDKENEHAGSNIGKRSGKAMEKGKRHAYPEISAPTLTDEALEAVKARFTLIPINRSAAEETEEGFSIIREESLVHIRANPF